VNENDVIPPAVELTAEEWAAIERRFWAEESKWAAAGSGQTGAQQTGAAMVFAWLRSPQGGRLQRADREWTSNELLGWDGKPTEALR